MGYIRTLPKYCFCFNLKKNSTVYQGVRRHCINYFWVINELYCAVALRALNIADIKPKALHDPCVPAEIFRLMGSFNETLYCSGEKKS